MSTESRVKEHFDLDAQRFDAIYDERKRPVARFVDDVWRGVVKRRFELTLRHLGSLEDQTVLDVGCGSGRYCIAFASNGAAKVVGLDFAPEMISLARKHADDAGVSEVCKFRVGAFPDALGGQRFDVTTAMGYFDYVENAAHHLSCIRELTDRTVVASFPKSREVRAPLRRIRFMLRRCPLFLYSRSEVETIVETARITDYDLVDMGRDFILLARV